MAVFVPDASVTLAWCFEDEVTPWTDSFLQRLKQGDEAVVPAHWSGGSHECIAYGRAPKAHH
jgi:hypothetical protein